MFELVLDTKNLTAALDALGRRGPIALARAINRTAASERTAMARAVAADMGLTVSTAREAIRVDKASATTQAARVTARGKRIPLIEFKARGPEPSRGRGRGVTYQGQGGRKTIPSAFLATVGTGRHRGVFLRRGRARLPIRELYGPSIAHVFATLIPVGEARRGDVLTKNVEHELAFELSKMRS
jgi:hypothetical protein